ncbi:DUF2703 domain-containing protein [Dongia deserti]|uniref:DUF2703 domain-containing protein n=1 Tax=Dongia deserti TaxID=2268030 RepID=UPI0013C4CC5D|nr:DUF2703 domain-containing protein [Dongia deserti]
MYLDLDVCSRCKGTDANLETALRTAQDMLEASGTAVQVRKTLIDSEAKARELRFVSSPTIRVNGQDIALELRESECDSCGEACGCGGSVACRVWVHEGKEYTEAPVPLIVNGLIASVGERVAGMEALEPEAFVLPENLKQFFAAKAAAQTVSAGCCSTERQESCCAPSDKKACCGSNELGVGASCGCG